MSTTPSPFLSYDPVLPSSPEDEQLTPVPTSHNTPGSSASAQPDGNDSPGAAGTLRGSNGLSVQTQQSTGFEYSGMEVSDFDNNYLFEAKFADLPVAEGNTDFTYFQEPRSATTTTGRSEDPSISRRSTGIATLSSHLMSPVLTDSSNPTSPIEFTRPVMEQRLLGGGAMRRMSSQSTAVESAHPSYTQQTPAPTSSSVNMSPEPGRDLEKFVAPLVHIESYSRGDSPARFAGPVNGTSSKGGRVSRSSLHLAAPDNDASEDGEYDEADDHERSRPRTTSGGSTHVSNGRTGLNPFQRNHLQDDHVMSLEEQAQRAELEAKNEQVSKWLSVSDTNSGSHSRPIGSRKYTTSKFRERAKSTSGPNELQADAFITSRGLRAAQDAQLPGPGALLDEESGDDDDNSSSNVESPPASVSGRDVEDERNDDSTALSNNEPRPQDAYPWIDPIYFPSQGGTIGQPETSNTAMMRFAMRAKDIETASRAATWGTHCRRLSDGDLQRVFGNGGLFSRLSISKDKEKDKDKDEWRQFKETVEQAALKLLPKRSNSSARRKQSEPTRPTPRETTSSDTVRKESLHKRKESLQSLHDRKDSLTASLKRIPSANKRPRSPRLNTSTSGLVAPATNIATLGANGPVSPTGTHSPTGKWGALKHAREKLSRHSSHDPPDPSLTELWTQQGGPPLPTLASASKEKDVSTPLSRPLVEDEEEDSDEVTNDKAVSMNLTPRHDMIIPTFDGFKMNVRDVNPRLPVWLVERLGQEQLRRYKKLVEFKVKHAQAKQLDNCSSGSHCMDKGGIPTYFPAKGVQKEPVLSHTGFTTAGTGEADEDEEAVADGVVTDAQFPAGVPIPPAKRLPAEFECPICFTVKKFYKPSDWSKHVHEDLQPFTCTFRNCPDPKSFKRKADWVRHENERHRQLEWWQCTEDGCAHQCFRRDNFVQHLVREHKMPEPKAKTTKPNKPAVRGPAKTKGRVNKSFPNDVAPEDKVLMMVETCRHETAKNAMDEPCQFCGNVCNSFKKLTVHLARHMEQISMPVLELIKLKDVTPDTIISPIEAKLPQVMVSPSEQSQFPRESISISPFDHPMDGSTRMQDLPGAFQPIRSGTGFTPATYNRAVHWGQPNGQINQIPTQTSSTYNGELEGSWTPSTNAYDSNGPPPYQTVHGGQGSYIQQRQISNTDIYTHMNGNPPHGLPISYRDGQSFHVSVGSIPNFSPPQWNMEQRIATSQAHQVAIPIAYSDTKGGIPFSQNPGDAGLYPGGQQQEHQQYYSQY